MTFERETKSTYLSRQIQVPEILRPIFTFFNVHYLTQCAQVNPVFHEIACSVLYYEITIRDDTVSSIFYGIDHTIFPFLSTHKATDGTTPTTTTISGPSRPSGLAAPPGPCERRTSSKLEIMKYVRILQIQSHSHSHSHLSTNDDLSQLISTSMVGLRIIRVIHPETPTFCFYSCLTSSPAATSNNDESLSERPSLCPFLSQLTAPHVVLHLTSDVRTSTQLIYLQNLLKHSQTHTFYIQPKRSQGNDQPSTTYSFLSTLLANPKNKNLRVLVDLDHTQSEPNLHIELYELFRLVQRTKCNSGKIYHLAPIFQSGPMVSSRNGSFQGPVVSITMVERLAKMIMEDIGEDVISSMKRITVGSKADYVKEKIWDEVDDTLFRSLLSDILLESLD